MPMLLRMTRNQGFWHICGLLLGLVFALIIGFYLTLDPEQNVIPEIKAAPVTVNCSGTAGAPTSVDEASLASDDVTFSDTGGDGYCELDASISATSVLIESGVVLTHDAEDTDGVTITTTGNFEIESGASIDVDEKGCAGVTNANDGRGPTALGDTTCTSDGLGSGNGTTSGASGGAGGGGYGGDGGTGTNFSGGSFYNPTNPTLFGASGGSIFSATTSGSGGGLVRLSITGTFTHNGTITADGGDGEGVPGPYASGGGSGGSIYITTSVFDGSTGTFSADGGAGSSSSDRRGGGGGGGRIAIEYTSGSFSITSSAFSADGGAGTETAYDGDNGTVYTDDTDSSIVNIFEGFTYDTDFSETTWIVDASADNQYCDLASDTSPSVAATNITLDGNLDCNSSSQVSMLFDAATSFTINSGADISVNGRGTDLEFDIPASDDQTWTNVDIVVGQEGLFTIDDAIDIDLAGTTTITANAQWTALTGLTIASGASINADQKGCREVSNANDGFGPTALNDNTCVSDGLGAGNGTTSGAAGGAGGGGYGGDGGTGTNFSGGSFYNPTFPTLFGASGGSIFSATTSGAGGGYIRLNITGSGTFTHNGTITADGGDGEGVSGPYASGGGAGGSIYVTTATLDGSTGTFSADGGDGSSESDRRGGAGSGGRIVIEFTDGAFTATSSNISADGGAGTESAYDGDNGTAYTDDTNDSAITIFDGFTYDTDFSETTWTVDASATNQYCDLTSDTSPSVSATTITLDGELDCNSSSQVSMLFDAATSFTINNGADISVNGRGTDLEFDIPAGNDQTWTNVTITNGQEGLFTIDDAIDINLAGTTTINANAQWTNLTGLSTVSGTTISADEKGCREVSNANDGFGPTALNDNTCVSDGLGSGNGSTSGASLGAGGGGYGGDGGTGTDFSGGSFYNPTFPTLFGASGGSIFNSSGAESGAGGGYIRLSTTGTFTHNGTITADGGDGEGVPGPYASGGGSGGSVYVTTTTFDGSTGTFSVDGGDGGTSSGERGGGGGGGRIAIEFTDGAFTPSSSNISADLGVGDSSAYDGDNGTAYTDDTNDSAITIFDGFTYDTDFSETTWTVDASAVNQYCDLTSDTSPSVTATTITLDGDLDCNSSSQDSMTFTASSSFSINSGADISVNGRGADLEFDINDGDDQTWTNVDIVSAQEGFFTIDDEIDITLAGTTSILGNAQWTNLVDLTIGASTSINADAKGCRDVTNADDGFGPTSLTNNTCISDGLGAGVGTTSGATHGAGGGGYGGAGGSGTTRAGGAAYSPADPTLFGASGGPVFTSARGGAGGGYVRLGLTGTLTHSGTISADGGDGTTQSTPYAGGGGSGGSIYITTGTYSCSAAIDLTAVGGDGADNSSADGGGGGGGRVEIGFVTDGTSGGCAFNEGSDTIGGSGASVIAAGGSGPGAAADGGTGSLVLNELALASNVSISGEATNQDLDGSYTISSGGKGIVDWKKDGSSFAILNLPFEDDSSTTNDYSNNTTDGTVVGATFSSTGGQDGKGAFVFDGSGDEITFATDPTLDGTSFTISAWVNHSSSNVDYDAVASWHNGGTDGALFFGFEDNNPHLNYDTSGGNHVETYTGTTVSADTWHHYALVKDGTNLEVFLDGASIITETDVAADLDVESFDFQIGDENNGVAGYTGTIDEFLLFDSALSDDQITQLYNGGSVSGAYDTIDSEETSEGDMWQLCVTPNNSSGDGSEVCSSTVTITEASGGSNTPPSTSGGGGSGTVTAGASLELTGPPSGSVFESGQLIPISWNSTGNIGNVTLSYSTNGGQTFTTLAHNIGDTGLYNWRPPGNLNSDNVLLRVIASDGVNLIASDNASGVITVGDPVSETPVTEPDDSAPELGVPSDVTDPEDIPDAPAPGDPGSTESPVQFVPRGRYVRTDVNPTIFFITPEGNKLPALDTRTFLTHKENFTEVVYVTEGALHNVPYQAPLLPRPGTVLATFQSDPRVYWIEHNPSNPDRPYLRHIDGEHLAAEIFGLSWRDYVLDMNPAFQAYFEREKPILTPEPLDKTQLQKREILSVMAGMRAPFDEESKKAFEIASMKAEHRPWYRKLVDKVRNVFR